MVARLPNYLLVPRRRASTMIRCRWRSCEPLFFIKLITDSSAASSLGALINCAPRSVVSRGATFLCLISFLSSHFCCSDSTLPVLQGLFFSLVAFFVLPRFLFRFDFFPGFCSSLETQCYNHVHAFDESISYFPFSLPNAFAHSKVPSSPLYEKVYKTFFFL